MNSGGPRQEALTQSRGAALFAALGGSLGAVMIRKGCAALATIEVSIDPGTTGYQRIIGGILVPTLTLIILKWQSARAHNPIFEERTLRVSLDKWRRIWPRVLINALADANSGPYLRAIVSRRY